MGRGGAERVATVLCNRWSMAGRDVTLMPTYFGPRNLAFELNAGVNLVYLQDVIGTPPGRSVTPIAKMIHLRRYLRAHRPDLIVSFLTNVNWWVVLATHGLGIPVVVGERVDPRGGVELPHSLRILRAITYGFADWLAVQTENTAVRLRARILFPPPVAIIANPLPDTLLAIPASVDHLANIGTVISLGRLVSQKRFELLIEAFAAAFGERTDWRLEIWGEGPLAASLEQCIDRHGLTGRAFICGPTVEPWKALSKAQMFALTSEYEGMPNAMLEAMALGLPCVSFDCPSGPRELAGPEGAAVIVPNGDVAALAAQLRRLADSPEAREMLGDKARERVRREYSLARILEQWDRLATRRGSGSRR